MNPSDRWALVAGGALCQSAESSAGRLTLVTEFVHKFINSDIFSYFLSVIEQSETNNFKKPTKCLSLKPAS